MTGNAALDLALEKHTARPIREQPVDDLIDLYRRTKAAQKRAERGGLSGRADALARIADMIAQEANMDGRGVVPFAPRAAVPAIVALPFYRQPRR